MQKEDEKRSFLKRYWWVFIGALGGIGLAAALDFSSTDGWIEITDYGNGSYDLGWNTTKPTICSAGNYSYWNGVTFLCSPDTTGGGSNATDGNNYTDGIAFENSSNNFILQLSRLGISSNLSAFFTLNSARGIFVNSTVISPNASTCGAGQYSRYDGFGWACFNDASGGSGTVTSVNVTTTSDNGSVLGSGGPVTVAGTINLMFYNATPFQTGLLTNTDFTTFNGKADVGDCVGYNSTHVNVTMNVSYGGPQCIAVALNPGGSSFDPSGLYINITDLQTSNSSTNTRVNTLNTSIQNLLTTNTTIFSALLHLSYNDTYMNGSINNLLTSNTSIYSSLLHLSYNDTNLNASINAVNTRATTINNTLVIVQQNVTDLQTSNLTKAPITSITSLNASINVVSTFAQTKAATGYSGDCPTGISGITINNGTAPNKTCAPAQGGAFVYSDYFNQNLNTSNNVTFQNIVTGTKFSTLEIAPVGKNMVFFESDFQLCNANALSPLLGSATSSGTLAAVTGNQYHPGVCSFTDSTTAGGAYRINSELTAFLLNGSEYVTTVFSPGTNRNTAAVTEIALWGFSDSTTYTALPTDGCGFRRVNWNWSGFCTNNSVTQLTATNFTSFMYAADWYVSTMLINPTATSVNFSIYNSSTGSLLWSEAVTARIPVISGRETGFVMIAGENTTNAAAAIMEWDYVRFGINRTIARTPW